MANHDIHKDYFIFFVLQFCYVFHDAPTNSDIKQEAERLSHKDSTTMQDLTQAPPIYLSSILNDRAVRSTPQPISKVYGDVDLCIFAKRDESIPTCDSNSADPMGGCVALNRLVVALMYYSRLDIFNNKKDQDMFAAFVSDVYSHCLDDYTHLLSKHKDVKAISNAVNAKKVLPSCDVTTCPSILGHPHQDTNSQLSMDNRTQFYVQIMDSVHCSIVHLLESDAISPRRNGGRQIERLSRRLDSNTTSFDRFKSGAKFAIIDDTWSHQDRTYMDEFYNHVVNQVNVTPSQADELEMFLNTHAYDSDVLKWDMKQEHSSFIAKYLKTNNCIQSAIVFVDREAISSSSYRLGFRFYYWPYYETLETMSISNEWFNSNELCPCPPREMYVKQKYSNFKEEIANYEHLSMRQYQTNVVAKVDSYMNTYAVKRLKAAYIPHLHCDIQPNEVVLHRHLVSLCLYTDYSDLSTHFSRTFTRNNMFESLTSVNARNSRYWWLSRSLYELVQFYGQSCEGQYNENTAEFEDKLCGPFFWGLYRLITFPEVSIRLYGPVSTSKQIEVAMKFSGKQGILVQLHTTGDFYCKQVRGFDASWFSRFAGEDETLFFGSDFRLRIESIRIIKTVHKPDEEAFYAFFIFECMLNGCRPPQKIKMTDTVNRYLTSLWNWKLNKTDPDTPIDPYISDTFVNICSRTQIALNLWCLDTLFPNEWTDLLMQSIKPQNDYDDVCNLFRADVFR
eukprot:746588_1